MVGALQFKGKIMKFIQTSNRLINLNQCIDLSTPKTLGMTLNKNSVLVRLINNEEIKLNKISLDQITAFLNNQSLTVLNLE